MQVRHIFSFVLFSAVCSSTIGNSVNAKSRHNKEQQTLPRCQTPDECKLSRSHYSLYAFVKSALDSRFDLNGKELLPFIKSVDVLRKRYQMQADNETMFIRNFLADERLTRAMDLFKSDNGLSLVTLYGSSSNGKDQNLACSEIRLRALEKATTMLDRHQELATVFGKVHRNFARKSARKCLKKSCDSIDANMRELDSVMGKLKPSNTWVFGDDEISDEIHSNQTVPSREYEKEELKLCQFLTRTNATDCKVTGAEMKDFDLSKAANQRANKTLEDLLKAYHSNILTIGKEPVSSHEVVQMQLASRSILQDSCHPLVRQLDYHLAALKWYREQGFIEKQKLSQRASWCPSLNYWLEVDRVCSQLTSSLDAYVEPIFEYSANAMMKL